MQLRQKFRADFLCYGKIIVEIKAVSSLSPEHYSQQMNYLKATGTRLGFLFNFGSSHLLQQKRIVC
jgi:GxxExxY protein